jgi:2-polyprenyl-3-methyl-5-hydroxy-6-metoxy-1,4-benzoquinol methylase
MRFLSCAEKVLLRTKQTFMNFEVNHELSLEIINSAKGFKLSRIPSSVAHQLATDPKHLGFQIARHKIVGKILNGKKQVLEIGCQDGFGTYIVSKNVERILAVDIESNHIEEAQTLWHEYKSEFEFLQGDITQLDLEYKEFEACYMMDVFEHIDPKESDIFLQAVIKNLSRTGIVVIGMPTKESQKFASEFSKLGHVNLFTISEAKSYFAKFFEYVFIFGMNDEMINLNYEPLNQYMIAILAGIK